MQHLCAQVGETYDWRLAVPLMQQRDGYFTRLKNRVEIMHQLQGEKVRRFHDALTILLPATGPMATGRVYTSRHSASTAVQKV